MRKLFYIAPRFRLYVALTTDYIFDITDDRYYFLCYGPFNKKEATDISIRELAMHKDYIFQEVMEVEDLTDLVIPYKPCFYKYLLGESVEKAISNIIYL